MVDFWQLNTTVTAPGAAPPQYTDALVLAQEINLAHQTVSPHERMGSGDETSTVPPQYTGALSTTQLCSCVQSCVKSKNHLSLVDEPKLPQALYKLQLGGGHAFGGVVLWGRSQYAGLINYTRLLSYSEPTDHYTTWHIEMYTHHVILIPYTKYKVNQATILVNSMHSASVAVPSQKLTESNVQLRRVK